jgi:Ca2+-binding EF-hand superfamily protein
MNKTLIIFSLLLLVACVCVQGRNVKNILDILIPFKKIQNETIAKQVFNYLDRDHNGLITASEIKSTYADMNQSITDSQIAKFVSSKLHSEL